MEIKKVVTGDDLGKAIAVNPETKKADVLVDGVTIKVNAQNQLTAEVQGGLDCDAIDALPIKPWKKDTVVLAKQDGECVRLKPNGDIFTDIVVNLAANKQNFEIGKNQSETVNLIATVTNAGTNPTGEVFVTLTKPQLGTYQVGTPTTNNIGEEKTGELTWKVPTMVSGKALVITLPVTLSAVGSFSFGLQATSTIDTDTTNNTKTFTFAVTAKNDGTNTNYVPEGTACPLIVATDLTHNQRLNVYTTGIGGDYYKEFGKYINVFADGNGFAGKRIKLEGASTVVVTCDTYDGSKGVSSVSSQSNYRDIYADGYSDLNITSRSGSNSTRSYAGFGNRYTGGYTGSCYSPSQEMVVAAGSFMHGAPWNKKTNASPVLLRDLGTFDPATQIFTFRSDLRLPTPKTSFAEAPYHCVLWCRPAGKDCRWQGIPIILGIKDKIPTTVKNVYEFSSIKGNVSADTGAKTPAFSTIEPDFINMANFVGGVKPNDLIAKNSGEIGADFIYYSGASYTVTVVPGQEAQFTLKAVGDRNELPKYIATGKTRTSYDASKKMLTVSVAADATATDSVYWDDLRIIVK